MKAAINRKPGWPFYAGWVALTASCIPIAFVISMAILRALIVVVGGTIVIDGQQHISEDYLLMYILVPILGLLTGLVQYLLLRIYLPRMGWWMAATISGFLLPLAIGRLVFAVVPTLNLSNDLGSAIAVVVFGGCIGLGQWLFLRRRVPRASLWMLASILGWGLGILPSGGTISATLDVIAISLLPPIAAAVAWWVLLCRARPVGTGAVA